MSGAKGFTLLEALVGMAILGIALASLAPVFLTFLDENTRAEERTGAVAVAQQTMERFREQDPSLLPTSGATAMEVISAGDRDFEVVTHFCRSAAYCSDDSRHLLVEVSYGGRTVYTVESVFTTLR